MQVSHTARILLTLPLHACIGVEEPGPIDGHLEYGVGDLDGDRRTDLVILNSYEIDPESGAIVRGDPNRIAFNDGDSGWTLVELWRGGLTTIGDFDGDGVDDLARATGRREDKPPLRVWMGGLHRDLLLVVQPPASREISMCGWEAVDYLVERPGEELLCGTYKAETNTEEIYVVTIGETIEALAPGILTTNVLGRYSNGDFDGDGVIDIVFAGGSPWGPALSLHRNVGGGQFDTKEYGRGETQHVNVGEFDGEPGLEIAYVELGGGFPKRRGERARLYWAVWADDELSELGSFELPIDSYWMEQGDIDLDGREELLVAHPEGLVRVDFDGPTPTMAELDLIRGILMDADSDGDLDMVRFDYDLDEIIVLTNDGTGSFTASGP
ncbi:MAG: hypothetical protein HC927_03150 [Deltaproteobacteria bacterium]|nr:hypothetical protein [Deltaproteobacteria bacterium]